MFHQRMMDENEDVGEILPLLKALDNLISKYRTDDSFQDGLLSAYGRNDHENQVYVPLIFSRNSDLTTTNVCL